ncbi:AAA family ATPase [Parvularcula sp. ZS-1/3]|uniref:AAA family ATPase n=1 Tax=Parvularcula mediterranea TaxID=2732508 RepID=A0A7Y3W6Q8_9PROT|nr:AAA family ATPase [Parvularcula mediterranea]NNU17541.1 AAA family ATPase [Parvularcula mediterranea]
MPVHYLNGAARLSASSPVPRDSASALAGLLPSAEHEETHLSHIFLTDDTVYKLKKSVHLPFADFSTIGKRHAACAKELEVNRESGGELYRDIVPLTRKDGEHAIDGEGVPVDWLVRMHRFGPQDRGDRAMEAGRISGEMLRDFVDHLYRRHEGTPKAEGLDWRSKVRLTLKNVAATLLEQDLSAETEERASRWFADLAGRFAACGEDLDGRNASVLDSTHGDLHLKNLCIIDGRVIAYDALEFDRDLVRIDPLYDLAFLVADLWHHSHACAANAVMNRYLGLSAAYEAAPLLSLYASLRLGIRALAEAMSDRRAEAEAYLVSAAGFLAPVEPVTLLLSGRSGTGKSSLAAKLATDFLPPPGAVHLRSDVLRKRMNNTWPEDTLCDAAYTPWARDEVYQRFEEISASISGRVPLILDIALAGSSEAPRLEDLATSKVWLTAPDNVLSERLKRRQGDASDADAAVMITQRGDPPSMAWTVIEATGSLDEVADRIREALSAENGEEGDVPYDPRHEV